MATQSVTGRDYIQKKKDNAKKALDMEKEALQEIIKDMCVKISNDKISHADDVLTHRYRDLITDDLIVPATEKDSEMIFYKIYEVLWQPNKEESHAKDKDLAFSVAISTTENVDKIDYDKDMLQDVKDFINWYVDPKYKKTSEMVKIANAGFDSVNLPQKKEKASTLLGVPLGGSGPERRGPFQDYPTFFNEYVESNNEQAAAEYAKTQFYSNPNGDCNVACSLLSASYCPKLDHEKKKTTDIEKCNTICGVLCRGALVRHDEFGSLIIKQVIGVEGIKPTHSSLTKRESIGIESHQVVTGTNQTQKEKQRDTYTVSEVHLPDYSSGSQAEGVRWYAIAERCIHLQLEALEAKYSNENLQILGLVKDAINFNVYRPSRTLLYAVMDAKWEVSRGEPIYVKIYYTLGAFIIRHKYTPGRPKNGAAPVKKVVWNAKKSEESTGPLYKALSKLNRLYKPERNKEVAGKNDDAKTTPTYRPRKPMDVGTETVHTPKTKDTETKVAKEKVPVNYETPNNDQKWIEVKEKKKMKKKSPPDQRDETSIDTLKNDSNADDSASNTEEVPKPKRHGSSNRFEALDEDNRLEPIKEETGIGHNKTLLAVAAAIQQRRSTSTNNISDNANLAAICAEAMKLNLCV